MCSGTMMVNSSRSRCYSSSFRRRHLKERASSIKTKRMNCPHRMRHGVHKRRQDHCSIATRHNVVIFFRRKSQGSHQYSSFNRSTTCVSLHSPQSYREYALFRGIYSAALRSTRRPSAAPAGCATAIQTPTPPERESGLRNCILRAVPRCTSQSRILEILQMCDTPVTSSPVPLPSRLAVLTARDAKRARRGSA